MLLWIRFQTLLCAAALLLLPAQPAAAAQGAGYVPDVAEFTGAGSLVFASQPILTLPAGGTLEFWVGADWADDPGYDPVVFANSGPQGPAYQVAIGADRQSLKVQSGDQLGVIAFDFSDGAMHHVGIVDFGDDIFVVIDGQPVGAVAMSLSELPTDTLWIGAGADDSSPFIGGLAALRIWDVPLGVEELVGFALVDITGPAAGHPDIDSLVGHSRFNEDDFYITDAIIVSAADVAEDES